MIKYEYKNKMNNIDELNNLFSNLDLKKNDEEQIDEKQIVEKEIDEEQIVEKEIDEEEMDNEICKKIILLFNNNEINGFMSDFWIFLDKVIKIFPPKKNENKFIYGKVSEYAFQDLLNKSGIKGYILGDDSYYNDFEIEYENKKILFSYKTTKGKGNIRLVNYHSSNTKFDITNRLLCIVNFSMKMILLFPLNILPQSFYCEKTDGLDISSKYIKYMSEKHGEYIYKYKNDIPKNEYNEVVLGKFIYEMLLHNNY